MLDKAEYSAFESTLNSSIVSYRLSARLSVCIDSLREAYPTIPSSTIRAQKHAEHRPRLTVGFSTFFSTNIQHSYRLSQIDVAAYISLILYETVTYSHFSTPATWCHVFHSCVFSRPLKKCQIDFHEMFGRNLSWCNDSSSDFATF